jgi:NADPH:quinone reductase-like Zn-dependent oxidoreductase
VLYGFMGGSKCDNFDLGFILRKRVSLIGTTLKSRTIEYKAKLLKELGTTLFGEKHDALQPGITPVLDKVFPMSKACDGHIYIESNQSIGKVLLEYDL